MAAESYQPGAPGATAKELARRWWHAEIVATDQSGAVPEHAQSPDRLVFPQNDACRLALLSKEGLRRCAASIACAHDKARARTGSLVTHECHLGLTLVAIGLPESEGTHVACGVRERTMDEQETERLRDRLRELRPPQSVDGPLELPVSLPPAEMTRLGDVVRVAAAEHAREADRHGARSQKPQKQGRRATDAAPPMVGQSRAMLDIQRLIERVTASDSTVLVQGESGTGKELVARQIHERGPRHERPFVAQNCSALNDNLLESALFGHVRGAFTGATRDARGLFELADGGTLFLDEIGDMSPALQVKLLRVLQEGTFTPVGAQELRRVDVRVVAATHKDLAEQVKRRQFREDLYYRVNVIRLVVPPLREREDDLPRLVDFFLRRHGRGEKAPRLSPDVLQLFLRYPWPGNVRELQNEIERLCVLTGDDDVIGLDLVSPRIVAGAPSTPPAAPAFASTLPRLNDAVEQLERTLIAESLRRNDGNRSRVARELGVARSNLLLKIERYGLG